MTVLRLRRLLAYALISIMPFGVPGCKMCAKDCGDLFFGDVVRSHLLGFRPGSYWIYRNTQNGDIDSVYLVSAKVDTLDNRPPECREESAYVVLKGFAGDKQWGYYFISSRNVLSTGGSATAFFEGDFDPAQTAPLTVNNQTFADVLPLTHCCLTGRALCYKEGCVDNFFRFLQLRFARNVGLIQWEAEYYPQYGNVKYELVRYRVFR